MCFSVGKEAVSGGYAPMVQVCAYVRFFMRTMRDAERADSEKKEAEPLRQQCMYGKTEKEGGPKVKDF